MLAEKTQDTLGALRRGELAGVRELRMPGLDEFPNEILSLGETLEFLDLGNGALTSLPKDFGRLRRLRMLFCSGNRFERLPPALGDCAELRLVGFRKTAMRELPGESLPPKLRWLTLTNNEISSLPNELGQRPLLQKLMLAGNRLDALPAGLANASALELIRLSANRFESLPPWLAELPGLAWISWGANPCEARLEPAAAPLAQWTHLDIGPILGEGASGRVHRAAWRMNGDGPPHPVALKMFKGAMTSDGLPAREMAACLAVGEHPNLTAALGRLADHPEGAQALLMPLLPPHWRNLAAPPSFDSCSRDVYDGDLRLSLDTARRIARGIAGAVAHLHTRGVMHGDLYAHNILWDGEAGAATLGDFGAACALPAGKAGDDWQRVETRAFGLLIAELLDLCDPDASGAKRLRQVANACVQPNPRARPLVADALKEI
jgi:hypothetical protein